jgi:hypothetical protein
MGYEATSGRRAARVRVPRRRLVIGAAQAVLLLFLVGADCADKQVGTTLQAQLADGIAPEVSVRAVGQKVALTPAGAAHRGVFVQCPKPGGPDAVTVLWYPPAGASSIAFPDVQPTNPQGPAPYEFADVAVSDVADAQAAASLTVDYAAPAPPQPLGAQTVVDVFTAVTAAGNRYSASFADTEVAPGGAPVAAAPRAGTSAVARVSARAVQGGGYSWWAETQGLTPVSSVPLDQALCQSWADLFQGGTFFVALRFPVQTPDASDARSAPLPLVVPAAEASAPRLELRATDPTPATVFGVPLELRPDRLAFAENNLPHAEGERWLTLAPAAQPAAVCPAGLTGNWALQADFALDLGGTASSCAECTIQEYLCYEGADAPFMFASSALGAQSTYQGAGTTCVGPMALRLVGDPPSPPFTLEGAGLARTSADALVQFGHTLHGLLAGDTETTARLTATSALGLSWQLYSDSALQHQITDIPVTISGSAQFDFWAAAHVPFEFSGQDSVTIVATSTAPGAAHTWTSDHFWAGAWTPPPLPPELHVGSATIQPGRPITVSGLLPDGNYRLVVVPNGAWLPGTSYEGAVMASLYVAVVNGTLPPTVVWPKATVGSYDVLALAGSCLAPGVTSVAAGDTRIVTGDGLSTAAAVSVRFGVSRHLPH